MKRFELILLDEASEFMESLPVLARDKIMYNIDRVANGVRDPELFKKLEDSDDIWEFRTLYNGIQYRLFTFWDTEDQTFVVATHGIVKKTQKTPRKEIKKAERIKRKYFQEKHNRMYL